MDAKQICESIESIVHFDKLKINILRFKWKDQVYKVSKVVQTWKVPRGDTIVTHFIVNCREQDVLCELSVNHKDMKWELVQYNALT